MDAEWKRLGQLLQARRTQLDPARFRKRAAWIEHAAEYGVSRRMIIDIETGGRTNYTTETIRAIEDAYRLRPGAIMTVLAGAGELPVQEDDPAEPRTVREEGGVRTVQATVRTADGEERQVLLPIRLDAIPGLEGVEGAEREQLIQQAIGAATHAAQSFLEGQGRARRAASQDSQESDG